MTTQSNIGSYTRTTVIAFSGLLAFILPNLAIIKQAAAYKPDLAANIRLIERCIAKSPQPFAKACFGKIADNCITESGNPAVVPPHCWLAEGAAWDVALDKTYHGILAEIGPDKADSKDALREAQEQWIKSRDLDCRVEEVSNPRTHGGIKPACVAEATAKRVDFLTEFLGADWVDN